MRSAKLMCVAAIAVLALLTIPARFAAQNDRDRKHQHHHYQLIDMGTFGGPNSSINWPIKGGSLNSRGVTVGWSATAAPTTPTSNPLICGGLDGKVPFITLAFRWQNGTLTDLGALPGANNCSEPTWMNAKGEIVGLSENGEVDPLLGFNQSRAVRWKDGQIEDLGSFGGNQNAAFAINDHGQITGNSQNTIPDPFCFLGETLRGFLWEKGKMRDLGTLGTGNCVFPGFINERGQIAGDADTTSTPNPLTGVPTHDPFLWENGTMLDLGTLGGAAGFVSGTGGSGGLNNRGQVIGVSSVASSPGACLTEGDPNCHPFLWDKGKLIDLNTSTIAGAADFSSTGGSTFDAYLWRNGVATDLGTLGGDCFSAAFAINSQAQAVGVTYLCDGSFSRAFLWENGAIVDLNTLIPGGSALQLVLPTDVNDHSEIAGTGVPPGVPPDNVFTQGHGFLLIPCDEHHPNIEGCDYSMVDAATTARVSLAPAAQHPPALTPRSRVPGGAWNRFRFPWGRRNLGSGPAPAPEQEPRSITGGLEADHVLNESNWFHGSGYCDVGNGNLTGYCTTNTPYGCAGNKDTTHCPLGAKAKNPGTMTCCLHGNCGHALVDLGRTCN
jgi:probable HAF family extracellular repeat protein